MNTPNDSAVALLPPLTGSPQPPKLRRDWIGKRVRIKNEIRNGMMTIPPDSVCVVRNIYRGADLVGPACQCCGVAIHISKVPWTDLEYLGENASLSHGDESATPPTL